MKVNLIYFKPSGKYGYEGEYETNHKPLYEVFEEVRQMQLDGKLPGLIEGPWHTSFHVLIDVPEHEHNHPHLIPAMSLAQELAATKTEVEA